MADGPRQPPLKLSVRYLLECSFQALGARPLPMDEGETGKRSARGANSYTLGVDLMEERGTLLIAEQGSELSTALGPWLSEYGHEVRSADNFQDVLMTLQNEKINTLVMDIRLLPLTSANEVGCEAIALVKGLHRNLPIIVVTEENNPTQEGRIRQKGIFYYHVKSFGMDELMLAISNALARSCR